MRFKPCAVALATAMGFALSTGAEASDDAATQGEWAFNFCAEEPAVNMALMPDGQHVVYYSGAEYSDHDDVMLDVQLVTGAHPHSGSTRVLDLALLDPANTYEDCYSCDPTYQACCENCDDLGYVSPITTPNNPTSDGDLFCTGHLVRPDSTFVAFGGTEYEAGTDYLPDGGLLEWSAINGLPNTHVFDDIDGWTPGPLMSHARWYPSVVNLTDGSTLVMAGIERLSDGTTQQTAVELFDAAGTGYTTVGDVDHLPLYPHIFLVSAGPHAGDIFYAGLGQTWGPLGEFYDLEFNYQIAFDPDTGTETAFGPTTVPIRDLGFCALAPLTPERSYQTQVICGGGAIEMAPLATNLVESTTLPLTGAGVERELVAPMNHPRWHPVSVHLADGRSLFVVGGTEDNPHTHGGQGGAAKLPVLVPEIYDWATDTWTEVAPMDIGRQYHTSAILLPDGRVLVGGTVAHAAFSETLRDSVPLVDQLVERRMSIYEPPYLHYGVTRPTINSEPCGITYGTTFKLKVHSESPIASVHLVRPGNSTHTLDTEQRVIHLTVKSDTSLGGTVRKLEVVGPPDAAVAPPGTYMLFVARDVGTDAEPKLVPSVAQMVEIY